MPNKLTAGLGGLALLILFGATLIGPTTISISEWASAWLGQAKDSTELIIFEIRLPRILAAFIVGASLGLAGAALQGLLRNPLAEPGVLGVSATSSLLASLAIVYGLISFNSFMLPLSAILGALLATAILVWVGWRSHSVTRLILLGVALASISGALMALLINFTPNPMDLSELVNWQLGSVANRSLYDIALVVPVLLTGALIIYSQRRGLAALSLGEETAHSLGIHLPRLRLLMVLGTGFLAGGAVALAGAIGFVGIVAPHIIRPWVGGAPDKCLIPSALLAGILLMIADMLVQVLPTARELQLGVLVAIIGAPVFAIIIYRLAYHD